ncbi:MAG TPA: flagellar assembly protein FliW [Actinoplanes sp.]|jgi:flagellar assembly factor FliW
MTKTVPIDERMTASTLTLPTIELAAPMPGFPAHRRFVLVRLDDEGLLYALTSMDDSELRFLVVPPAPFFPDYAPEIGDDALEALGRPDADEILLLLVITASEAQTSANLLAPIVVNQTNRRAIQVVLNGTDMPVRALMTASA